MSVAERIFHAVLFEILAITFSIIALILFTDQPVAVLSGTMITIATIAMIWNYFFNLVFDRFFPGEKTLRPLKLRIFHVVLFEAGLICFTVPVFAYALKTSLLHAFLMDLSMTIFITCYAFVFNLLYDHLRALLIRRVFSPA
ncbi:hypothetical protein VST7929_01006 [Vibrio stylophorae]|uniref:Chlorhexidine efflux transporter domain-containing protein n=1 Tax=Vibrio stylophorae TaxID=659351 RepID=A0ABM8ZS58_9VIBR|nr:PACE efflux transporter [Vibrio stylophorae]CAH0533145.1 hypothetical protein VST7929_01006 [Vibrio stylophorae]